MQYEINDKPQELMTEKELDDHYLKRTGKTYKQFVEDNKGLTEEEKKKYELE